ncbi:hypothetical protein LX36DRAFT_197211 [Colletotrichum falcatum]|nr:hypothetical protein LX36DRAFT_197211 [Colletotrichum falcatum]
MSGVSFLCSSVVHCMTGSYPEVHMESVFAVGGEGALSLFSGSPLLPRARFVVCRVVSCRLQRMGCKVCNQSHRTKAQACLSLSLSLSSPYS